jgi:hypothetical protein
MSATRKKGTTCLRSAGELALALTNQLLDVSQPRVANRRGRKNVRGGIVRSACHDGSLQPLVKNPDDRRCEDQAVDAVKHTAVAGQ